MGLFRPVITSSRTIWESEIMFIIHTLLWISVISGIFYTCHIVYGKWALFSFLYIKISVYMFLSRMTTFYTQAYKYCIIILALDPHPPLGASSIQKSLSTYFVSVSGTSVTISRSGSLLWDPSPLPTGFNLQLYGRGKQSPPSPPMGGDSRGGGDRYQMGGGNDK